MQINYFHKKTWATVEPTSMEVPYLKWITTNLVLCKMMWLITYLRMISRAKW
jgi:hypothetical protein